MKDAETSRLRNFAKALIEGNRKNAMRICRNVLNDPVRRIIQGKREVWERWHEQLKKPDPVGGHREMVALIMNDPLSETDYDRFMDEYEERARSLSFEYHYALLNYQLMRAAKDLRRKLEKLKETSKVEAASPA